MAKTELRPAELRAEYICGHAVAFWALGGAGKSGASRWSDPGTGNLADQIYNR